MNLTNQTNIRGGINLQKSRWLIAAAAVVMQLCLGTVYAWSVFKKPLMAAHGWTETETQITFMICIGMIGVCAAFGGAFVDKKGPGSWQPSAGFCLESGQSSPDLQINFLRQIKIIP